MADYIAYLAAPTGQKNGIPITAEQADAIRNSPDAAFFLQVGDWWIKPAQVIAIGPAPEPDAPPSAWRTRNG